MKEYSLLNGDTISEYEIKSIFKWCKKHIGKSKYHSIQKLILVINTKLSKKVYGYFFPDKNSIHINPLVHHDRLEIVATMIHEYVHFTQDTDEYDIIELKLPRSSNYYDHPHEAQAEDMAQKLKKKCYKELEL